MTEHPAAAGSGEASDAARLPLTLRQHDDILFWRGAEPVTCAQFLSHVAEAAEALPPRRHAINLCQDRYRFLVGFAAALVRGQVSLLSSDRSPHRLRQLADRYPDAYVLHDDSDCAATAAASSGVEHVVVAPVRLPRPTESGTPPAVPSIPGEQIAAIVFTSGSTGEPVGNVKPWAALVACTLAASERFGFGGPGTRAVVGTVPPQHMYGFETTILMLLHASVSSYAGSTFFPHDVEQALSLVPAPRVLVTTPVHLRALLAASPTLPPVERIISATAPLSQEAAREAETVWRTEVHEIFGATEVGSIASRRTVAGDLWRAYRGVSLDASGTRIFVSVPHLPSPVELHDHASLSGQDGFRLLGRKSDIVKIAGKRASLSGLNKILNDIDGVEDGVFFLPDDLDTRPGARLLAFVVAPSRSSDEILAALRQRLEAPFLPRRVVMVDALPRNPVGKLTRRALLDLDTRPLAS
ncbi:MAG TPA: AMP-binding protein [Stellaceae bacterium]|jgi:acyl-coenzyme A synthetase/AMP-(fatty) acid ligase